MYLKLIRDEFTKASTLGKLYIDGEYCCETLEDTDRRIEIEGGLVKIHGRTAIPRGLYKITVTWSPRFKQPMPLLHDVPYFTGIRIHTGNHAGNTEGCILVGETRSEDWIGQSRSSYQRLLKRIEDALAKGEKVMIEIV